MRITHQAVTSIGIRQHVWNRWEDGTFSHSVATAPMEAHYPTGETHTAETMPNGALWVRTDTAEPEQPPELRALTLFP